VGQASVPSLCFTVEWLLNLPACYGGSPRWSLNLFEEDLQDFEVYTGPIVQPSKESQTADERSWVSAKYINY
jgi:hypothetical protein